MIIKKEEQVITDINSLQVDNAREQAKLYYEANKEEIWVNTLREKDKEIDRLNNIINDFEEELEREINISEEDAGLEHNTYIDIKSTLEKVLKNFKELKEGDK